MAKSQNYSSQCAFYANKYGRKLYINKNQTLKTSMHTLPFTDSESINMANISYLENPLESEDLYEKLCQPVRNWFKDKFPDFTKPQKLAIPSIMNGDHLLLCSPTGSGKTLTAFLTIIDNLVRHALDGTLEERVYCLYISPIKALANDIQKNLIGPLEEIEKKYLPDRAQGKIRVGLRTGDTPQSERQKMLRKPPHPNYNARKHGDCNILSKIPANCF